MQEHLGWSKDVHVVGHSIGGMIATRLAALAPERLASLTLISVTSGGFQIIPRSWRALKYALQVRHSIAPGPSSAPAACHHQPLPPRSLCMCEAYRQEGVVTSRQHKDRI